MKKVQFCLIFLLFTLCCSTCIYSQSNLDSLWGVWQDKSQVDTTRLSAIHQFIHEGYAFSQPDSALYFAQLAYQLAQKTGKEEWIAKTKMETALPYYVKGDYNKFVEYTYAALRLWEAIGAENEMSMCYLNLGAAYGLLGNSEKALEILFKGLALQEKLGDKNVIGQTLNNISQILDGQNDYTGAINYLLKALELYEELGAQKQIAIAYGNLGNIYNAIKDHDKALEFYTRALEITETLDNPFQLALCHIRLAGYYGVNGLRNFDEAILWQTKALDIYTSIGNEAGVTRLMSDLGRSYEEKGDWEKAISHYRQSLESSEGLAGSIAATMAWAGLGRIEMYKGNYARSIEYANQSLTRLQNEDRIVAKRQITGILYRSHKALGNYKKALTFYEENKMLTDSMEGEKKQRDVFRTEYQYNYEKQALADSLEFAQKEAITNLQLEKNEATLAQQRLGLITTLLGLLLLGAVAYFFYQSKKRQEVEARRVKELDAFKSTFYTNITHEFRTPLTVILGMNQQIKAQPEKFLHEGTKLIERNGKNLLHQINQILDLSKLETNSLQLNMVQSDIVEFLRYSTEAFQSFANGQNLSLRFFSPVEQLLMDYDPESMQNIMSNLISNAMKFTPEGGDVRVALEHTNQRLVIKVQDTGIGISEKDLPHIFDRFYQVENKKEQQTNGTGIGLAYVQELVKALGGTISVESKIKEGTSFVVSLPIRNEAILVEKYAPKKEQLNWIPSQTRIDKIGDTKITIDQPSVSNENLPLLLLIEDNADVVIYLKSCLEDQYQIEVAYNGRIGIEKAIENIPDLIISDVMMPEKDGFEVCDALKNDERTSHIPLILLTAKADAPSKIDGLKRGADAYLAKPFDKEELLVRLEMLVERQKRMVSYFSKNNADVLNDNNAGEVIEIEDVFIKKVNAILEANISDEDFGLPQLCQKVRMSRSQLFRKMKALTDTAPSTYIKNYRLTKAKALLENSDTNVAEAAYAVGFKDPSYFTKIFQDTFDQLPGDLKKQS